MALNATKFIWIIWINKNKKNSYTVVDFYRMHGHLWGNIQLKQE